MYTEIARIADSMTERFGRGEEPINLGNASLVELLAFVSAFGPIAQGLAASHEIAEIVGRRCGMRADSI